MLVKEVKNSHIKGCIMHREKNVLSNNTRSFEPLLEKVLVTEENWQWKKKRVALVGSKKEKISAM